MQTPIATEQNDPVIELVSLKFVFYERTFGEPLQMLSIITLKYPKKQIPNLKKKASTSIVIRESKTTIKQRKVMKKH